MSLIFSGPFYAYLKSHFIDNNIGARVIRIKENNVYKQNVLVKNFSVANAKSLILLALKLRLLKTLIYTKSCTHMLIGTLVINVKSL